MAHGAWRNLAVLAAFLAASPALAQVTPPADPVWDTYGVFDLPLGKHARELPFDRFMDYACGTNGGPPSRPIGSFVDFKQCPPEPDSGLHEVYYRYDDEAEYWARAYNLENKILLFQGTTVYAMAVILSALFDDDGFYVGYRIVSDPRVSTEERLRAVTLRNFMMGRFEPEGWDCHDLPRLEGETPVGRLFLKQNCTKTSAKDGLRFVNEGRIYRKPGQAAVDPRTGMPLEGQFESGARFEARMIAPIPDRARRLAEIAALPAEDEGAQLAARLRSCAGCDLGAVNMKRRALAGANLAGAKLEKANFHDANLAGANFEGADLTGVTFNKTDLRRANLRGAKLTGAQFYSARLEGADMTGADLTETHMADARMTRVKLDGATLDYADMRGARLGDASLIKAKGRGTWFASAQMGGVNLEGATFVDSTFHQALLGNAILRGADLNGTDFFGADLRNADMTGADLSQTRLMSAILLDTILDGVKLDQAIMPDGTPHE